MCILYTLHSVYTLVKAKLKKYAWHLEQKVKFVVVGSLAGGVEWSKDIPEFQWSFRYPEYRPLSALNIKDQDSVESRGQVWCAVNNILLYHQLGSQHNSCLSTFFSNYLGIFIILVIIPAGKLIHSDSQKVNTNVGSAVGMNLFKNECKYSWTLLKKNSVLFSQHALCHGVSHPFYYIFELTRQPTKIQKPGVAMLSSFLPFPP